VTEFNTTIRSERVTVVVTHYEPEIIWSREEDQWPAQIEYDLFNEDGQILDWVLTQDENHELLNDYYANELENMG
jgi:hypothetical protein